MTRYELKKLYKNLKFKISLFVSQEAMTRKLNEIYLKMDWIERLDITTPKFEFEVDADGNKADLANNDFQRESLL